MNIRNIIRIYQQHKKRLAVNMLWSLLPNLPRHYITEILYHLYRLKNSHEIRLTSSFSSAIRMIKSNEIICEIGTYMKESNCTIYWYSTDIALPYARDIDRMQLLYNKASNDEKTIIYVSTLVSNMNFDTLNIDNNRVECLEGIFLDDDAILNLNSNLSELWIEISDCVQLNINCKYANRLTIHCENIIRDITCKCNELIIFKKPNTNIRIPRTIIYNILSINDEYI